MCLEGDVRTTGRAKAQSAADCSFAAQSCQNFHIQVEDPVSVSLTSVTCLSLPAALLLLLLPVQLLLTVQLLLAIADAIPDSCSKAICAGHDTHYPSWLNNSSAPADCCYAGIGLVCEGNSTLILPIMSHRYVGRDWLLW